MSGLKKAYFMSKSLCNEKNVIFSQRWNKTKKQVDYILIFMILKEKFNENAVHDSCCYECNVKGKRQYTKTLLEQFQ